MQFLGNSILALAIVTSGLLPAILAAPTRAQVMHDSLSSTVENRQCMDTCAGAGELRQDGFEMIPRQILNRPHDQQDDGVQSRQTMLAMGADEGEVESRQIYSGMMAEEDGIMSKQMDAWVSHDQSLE